MLTSRPMLQQNLTSFTLICGLIFCIGYGLSWLLFAIKHKVFRGSMLEKKVVMWLPIFCFVLLFSYSPGLIRCLLLAWLIYSVWHEVLKQPNETTARIYALAVSIGLLSSLYIHTLGIWLLLSVWLMSVLSDVVAFFAGNFLGKYHLPKQFNSNKSWDGVVGQIIGALLGALVLWPVIHTPVVLALAVGLGSAIGDMSNSFVKRKLHIKDWSNGILGHGGYADRFSSLSFALLLASLYLYMHN